MHPRLAELVAYSEEARRDLLAAAAEVPPSGRDRRPDGGWSAADVLDHLAQTEAGIARMLGKRLARAKEAGLPPET